MTDESQLQLTPKDGSSVALSKARSGLIARGRMDAAKLAVSERIDPLLETHELAEEEDLEAQNIIAFELYEGGDDADLAEAVRLWRKTAEKGHAESQDTLGNLYSSGTGVPRDHAEAARWWRKAADQGYGSAQCKLGDAYHQGKGLPQDYVEAVRWWRNAADQEWERGAQCSLGVAYYQGEGVPQCYAEAVRWFRKAADKGCANAQFALGLMYYDGKGLPQDYVEAHRWLSLADASRRGKERLRLLEHRRFIAKGLPPEQLAEAQQVAADELRRVETISSILAALEESLEAGKKPPPLPPIRPFQMRDFYVHLY